METLVSALSDHFRKATLSLFPQLPPDFACEVSPSKEAKFGDYQYNSAMRLSRPLKKSGREIAEAIAEAVDLEGWIESLEVAGPGFINIWLSPAFLARELDKMAQDPRLSIPLPGKLKRMIVEFSSPNVAKELHVGHLRSTIIGDSLARLFEFLGHDVLRLNHIGDWGTSFGMLIAYLKEEAPAVLSGKEPADLSQLQEWYKAAKKRFDRDLPFKKRSQLQVVALQSGERAAERAWEIICAISRAAYEEIYSLLGVKLVERGESFYQPFLQEVVADLESKGLVEVSDGAKCLFLEGFTNRDGDPLPMIVQKSDGGYNYTTTDLAALFHRIHTEKAERIIVVTDAGQQMHFQMLFAAAKRAGWWDPAAVRIDHVPFGLVLGPDGKKFRTREGETERLIDLLNRAIERAAEIIEERSPEMAKEEKKELARILGIGAVKYADLACNRVGDYHFSYERMLRFEGNTATFLLYSYVRIAGIQRKIGQTAGDAKIELHHPSEVALGLHLLRFREALQQMSEDLLPNRLTDYLYQLAQLFNGFYRDCQVEGSPEEGSRLQLAGLTARTLKQGLALLGVETAERM